MMNKNHDYLVKMVDGISTFYPNAKLYPLSPNYITIVQDDTSFCLPVNLIKEIRDLGFKKKKKLYDTFTGEQLSNFIEGGCTA